MQLWLSALCLFAHHPEVQVVQSMFVWLKEADGKNNHECISVEKIRREQMPDLWRKIMPRVEELERRHRDLDFPPYPGQQCRWCPVSSCEYHGGANVKS
jgi:hypothetical protein